MASTRLLETCWLIARASTSDEIWDTAQVGLERITGGRVSCAPASFLSSVPDISPQIEQLFKDIAAGWNGSALPELILTDDARCAGSACAGKYERFGAIALEA